MKFNSSAYPQIALRYKNMSVFVVFGVFFSDDPRASFCFWRAGTPGRVLLGATLAWRSTGPGWWQGQAPNAAGSSCSMPFKRCHCAAWWLPGGA